MKALYSKLLAIQKEIKAIEKTEDNPFFHSKYFSIDSVITALKPLLAKFDLVVLQPLFADGIKTIVIDPESGESLEWATSIPQNPDPQKQGAVITYFRRYALVSLFLIQGEADDDASSAVEKRVPIEDAFSDEKPEMNTCSICGRPCKKPYSKCYSCGKKV